MELNQIFCTYHKGVSVVIFHVGFVYGTAPKRTVPLAQLCAGEKLAILITSLHTFNYGMKTHN